MRVRPRAATRLQVVAASWRHHRELLVAIVAAWLLVIASTAVFFGDDQSFFNSDEAIVGLMAKHLTEGRAFPLFFYGQTFLLAVQAWIAAPFFAVGGPTVAALRASVIATDLAVATLLILGLSRWGGLRPLLALVAASFFVLSTPYTTALLVDAAAASVCPFVYVLALWMLRDRPLWFGSVLAVGFLNREFTIYAIPVLLVADVWSRRLFNPERIRIWLLAGVTAVATWQAVQALKPYADLMGPGTRGELIHGFDGSQIGNLSDRMSFVPSEIPSRVSLMFREHLPTMFGVRRTDRELGIYGYDWMRWPLMAGLTSALARALFLAFRHRRFDQSSFGWYLTGVGLTAIGMYVVTRPAGELVDRYLLLSLLLPIGTTAVYLAVEQRPTLRAAMVALVLLSAVLSASDHVRQVVHYRSEGGGNELRTLIDTMVARRIQVAEAGYWRAYKITFLAQERVKVASTDVIRIDEYQRLATAAGSELITIRDEPCPGGEVVVYWYLCRPEPTNIRPSP